MIWWKSIVIEVCPHCWFENEIEWDVETDGYETCCLSCGEKMMLCSECPLLEYGCDWQKMNEEAFCHFSANQSTIRA